jgi:hypothetical protein
MNDTLSLVIQVLNDPIVRAFQAGVTALTLLISIFAFKRTSQVLKAQQASLRAEQRRVLEMQWSEMNKLILTNSDAATEAAKLFGSDSDVSVRREMLHRSYLNILSTASSAYRSMALDQSTYQRHMNYFFSNYKGDSEYLLHLIKTADYHSEFQADCRARLAVPKPTVE